jgi:hypothetical protein
MVSGCCHRRPQHVLQWPRGVAAAMVVVVEVDCRTLMAVGVVIIAVAVVAVHSPPIAIFLDLL